MRCYFVVFILNSGGRDTMNSYNDQNIQHYQLSNLVAQSKFSLISPIISGTYSDDTIIAYFKRVSTQILIGLMVQKESFLIKP